MLTTERSGIPLPRVEGELDYTMQALDSLQREIELSGEASQSSAFPPMQIPGNLLREVKAINDSVFELCKPPGRPSVEIVFFPGLHLDGAADAHFTSWLSAGGTELWPRWILEEIPHARILSMSYDASSRRQPGLVDMYMTCENLLQDLMGAQVGQSVSPVVLVGHSIGCLMMKEVCIRLDPYRNAGLSKREENLLLNVKGLFYFSNPHYNSELGVQRKWSEKRWLFDELTALTNESQRRNEAFQQLRRKFKWKTYGIHEGHPTTLNGLTGFVVQEASARCDVDGFYTDTAADHFNICRPASRTSSTFRLLQNFIADMSGKDKREIPLRQFGVHPHSYAESSQDDHPSPVKDDLEELCTDPITMDLMCDPVKCSDGMTYCRWTISDNIGMVRSPFNRNVKLVVYCDDIPMRSLLFRIFPGQECKFRERRSKYREEALQEAHGDTVQLESAIEKLNNVLKWAPGDIECQNELAKVLDLVHKQSSTLFLLSTIPEVMDEDVAKERLHFIGVRLAIVLMFVFITIWFFFIWFFKIRKREHLRPDSICSSITKMLDLLTCVGAFRQSVSLKARSNT